MSKAGVFVASQSFLHTIHNWRWSSQRLAPHWRLADIWWPGTYFYPLLLSAVSPVLTDAAEQVTPAQCAHWSVVSREPWGTGEHWGHVTWSHWSSANTGGDEAMSSKVIIGSSLLWPSIESPSTSLLPCVKLYTGCITKPLILGSFCTITWINYMMIQNNVLPIYFGLMEDFIKWNIGCE